MSVAPSKRIIAATAGNRLPHDGTADGVGAKRTIAAARHYATLFGGPNRGIICALPEEISQNHKLLEGGVKMLIRSSAALLLVLILSVPVHAQLLRRAIEHRMEGNAFDAAACNADAARLCPGTSVQNGSQLECLKGHADQLSFGCAKEMRKLSANTMGR